MTTAYYQHRPTLRRNSPLAADYRHNGFTADVPMLQRIDVGDSSDDEIPQPMKFSALTKALLESDVAGALPSPKRLPVDQDMEDVTRAENLDTPVRAPILKIVRKPSPHLTRSTAVGRESRNASPRIVQINRDAGSASRSARSESAMSGRSLSRDNTPGAQFVTPAPAARSHVGSRARAGSMTSGDENGASGHRSQVRPSRPVMELSDVEANVSRNDIARSGSAAYSSDTAGHRQGDLAMSRSKQTTADHTQGGGTRVKRATVGTGSFLRGAPMRRGFRRRESEDQPSPDAEMEDASPYKQAENPMEHIAGRPADVRPASRQDQHDAHDGHVRGTSHASADQLHNAHPSQATSQRPRAESLTKSNAAEMISYRVDSAQSRNAHVANRMSHKSSIESLHIDGSVSRSRHQRQGSGTHASYKAPPLRVVDAASDQENMPPPTFKRNKESDFKILGQTKADILVNKMSVAETPVPVPQQAQSPRRALGQLSANTPQRPAPPPPPKMNVLDTATKVAGASAVKQKKRRAHIVLNGKLYTQLGKLGKGGSSDVYSVMAENHKLFALKRVKLGDCDETAIRGYKGEIDLLQKLNKVERVIALYDWELDEPRGILSLLMEKGEGDLNRVLSTVLAASEPKLDTVFVRWWWREMLTCVDAVHTHDIVHSDLKPANFLVVGGRLKLIDFGIANAIDIDNTVNVHRDTHIGTPNYMSPESITDTNAPMPGQPRTDPSSSARVMKLGKPSDVWSLGCILYQMVYGRPPFAHIPNQISRVMAITNSRVVIDFPANGLGGVAVPPELKGTLRRCLQRDPALRPTVKKMLAEDDPFLYPDAAGRVGVTEELLGVIIARVVERCTRSDAAQGVGEHEVAAWAKGFLGRVVEMQELEGVKEGLPVSASAAAEEVG